MENPIIEELQAFTKLGLKGKQQAYYEQMAADAKPVQCVSIYDVFTDEEIRLIKEQLRPRRNQCYRNAALLADYFPDRVKYVEGFGWNGLTKVEHAFNRVGEKYIDITYEIAIDCFVDSLPYVSLIEAGRVEIIDFIIKNNNIAGGYYLHKYAERFGV